MRTGLVFLAALVAGSLPVLADGVYTEQNGTYTKPAQLPTSLGGSGVNASSATDGQLLIGQTSDHTLALATITGTANRVTVTNGGHTITLSGPQDLATGSSPTFSSLTLTNPLTVGNGGTGATTATANTHFAAPNGSNGAPSFRALVDNDAPVTDANGLGFAHVIRKSFSLSASADLTIYSSNAPFGFTIVDTFVVVTTAIASRTLTLRSASGGGGNALSQAFSGAATGYVRNTTYAGVAGALPSVAANGSLFLNSAAGSGTCVGFVVILVRRRKR